MQQILIANSLADGFVVFLTVSHDWSANFADAAIADNEKEATALLSAAKSAEAENVVIDPYLVDVEIRDGRAEPTEYREFIRVFGPSVAIPSSKQSPA